MSHERPAGPAADVTVVIITHNRPHYLRTALWSVLQQRGGAPPVIVVDDGSTPPASVEGFEGHDVRIIRNDPPRGASGARNAGVEHVTTPWVAFLDDDDLHLPGHLAGVREAIARGDERLGMVYAGAVVADGDRTVLGIIPAYHERDLPRALLGGCPIPSPSCVAVRAQALRELGGFDEDLKSAADWDMWLRVVRAGWTPAGTAEPTMVYTRHAESLSGQFDLGLADHEVMKERYGAEAARAGVRHPDEGYPSNVALRLLAGGHRRAAARTYLESFGVRRKPRDLVLAALALAGRRPPRWTRRLGGLPPEFGDWAQRLQQFEGGGSSVAAGR